MTDGVDSIVSMDEGTEAQEKTPAVGKHDPLAPPPITTRPRKSSRPSAHLLPPPPGVKSKVRRQFPEWGEAVKRTNQEVIEPARAQTQVKARPSSKDVSAAAQDEPAGRDDEGAPVEDERAQHAASELHLDATPEATGESPETLNHGTASASSPRPSVAPGVPLQDSALPEAGPASEAGDAPVAAGVPQAPSPSTGTPYMGFKPVAARTDEPSPALRTPSAETPPQTEHAQAWAPPAQARRASPNFAIAQDEQPRRSSTWMIVATAGCLVTLAGLSWWQLRPEAPSAGSEPKAAGLVAPAAAQHDAADKPGPTPAKRDSAAQPSPAEPDAAEPDATVKPAPAPTPKAAKDEDPNAADPDAQATPHALKPGERPPAQPDANAQADLKAEPNAKVGADEAKEPHAAPMLDREDGQPIPAPKVPGTTPHPEAPAVAEQPQGGAPAPAPADPPPTPDQAHPE